jgi:hypothetical protein
MPDIPRLIIMCKQCLIFKIIQFCVHVYYIYREACWECYTGIETCYKMPHPPAASLNECCVLFDVVTNQQERGGGVELSEIIQRTGRFHLHIYSAVIACLDVNIPI